MKKLGLSIALFALSAFAGQWTGYISDSKCGAKHQSGSDADISCVKGCIKGGAKPVLVTGGKVVNIANPAKVTEELLGKKVTVTGNIAGDALTIDTIAAAK